MMGSTAIRGPRTLNWLALSLLLAGCTLEKKHDSNEEALPFELSREECDNLVEIESRAIHLKQIDGPDKSQQALDAARPAEANLADYSLTFTVDQTFENLLDRPLVIESASR